MVTTHRLLIHEIEPVLQGLLADQLAGWQVDSAAGFDHLLSLLPARAVLLALADGAVEYAVLLRRAGFIGPIFHLGLSALPPLIGLAKPLRVASFIARLQQAADDASVDGAIIGPWRLDTGQRALVLCDGDRVERLTDKELDVLRLLLLAAPGTVSRERLQTEIWRYHADASSHTVETHVWRLRQKLETGGAPCLLTDSEGYRLTPGTAGPISVPMTAGKLALCPGNAEDAGAGVGAKMGEGA